jgi:hypothetical protein
VWMESSDQLKKYNDLIGNRTRDFPALQHGASINYSTVRNFKMYKIGGDGLYCMRMVQDNGVGLLCTRQ